MSKITEMARAEADETEAVEGEEAEPDDTTQPDETTEPETATTPAEPPLDPEAIGKAVENAHKRYEKALQSIPGLQFEAYVECSRCNTMGYTLADFQPEPEYLSAPDKTACDECNGHGMVISGSLHEQHALEQCTKCAGNGWVTIARPAPTPLYPAVAPPSVLPTQPNAQGPYRDFWGQPTQVPPDFKGDPWGAPTYGQQLQAVQPGSA